MTPFGEILKAAGGGEALADARGAVLACREARHGVHQHYSGGLFRVVFDRVRPFSSHLSERTVLLW